jgi:hypothetical protein
MNPLWSQAVVEAIVHTSDERVEEAMKNSARRDEDGRGRPHDQAAGAKVIYRRPLGHTLAEKVYPETRVMIQIGG